MTHHPMIDPDRVGEFLSGNPGRSAREIAKAIEVDRRSLNQLLHSSLDRFTKDPTGFTWSNRVDQPGIDTERPPGPFGPAKSLIPPGQELHLVGLTEPCHDVLAAILDRDFSAIPVTDQSGRVVGVATAESILEHLRVLAGGNVSLEQVIGAPIRNALEPARFIAADTFIDLQVDWKDIQHVIVGTPNQPLGILTVSDVWQVLHRFTEAFVLIHEVEIGLRRIISRSIEATPTSVGDLLGAMRLQPGQNRPRCLEELTFNQYIHLMYSSVGRPHFEPVMGPRAVFRPTFDDVNAIRNDVMHFRDHAVEETSLATLRKYRMVVRG